MYYILECPRILNSNGEALTELHNYFEVGDVWDWSDGLPLEEEERGFPVPILIDYDPLKGYGGSPPELDDLGIPIISKRLKEVLLDAGVDNIEFFPAIIRNTKTAETYDYFVFKLAGRVSLMDLEKSEYETYDDKAVADVSIYNLVIDEKKAHGLLMFRMAEDISAIVVHEKIKLCIEKANIDTVKFVLPEEYVQL